MKAFEGLLDDLRTFCAEIRGDGPFYFGDQMSMVDISLMPYACRYYALHHYRGDDYAIPTDDPSLERFHVWLDAMSNVPSVAATIPERDRYIAHVKKYADGDAKSKVHACARVGNCEWS